jgi:hypothetical protein
MAFVERCGVSVMVGGALIGVMLVSQGLAMGGAIHPNACSPYATVMTTFTPDLRC